MLARFLTLFPLHKPLSNVRCMLYMLVTLIHPCAIYEKVKIIIILPLIIEDNKTKEGYLVWSHLAYKMPSKHVTERETSDRKTTKQT